MNRTCKHLVGAAVAWCLLYAGIAAMRPRSSGIEPAAPAAAAVSPDPAPPPFEPTDAPARLEPSSVYWDFVAPEPEVRFVTIGDGRRLAVVGDTLYMLNADGQQQWRWSAEGPPLTSLPMIDRGGTIYVVGYDLLWAAVDGETGRELWRGTACGRAHYGQIGWYTPDVYFVLVDMEGYRDGDGSARITDQVYVCRGNDILWTGEVPAGARLVAREGRLEARWKSRGRDRRAAIRVPDELDEPIGKVSATYQGESLE